MGVSASDFKNFQKRIDTFSKGMLPQEIEIFMKKISMDILSGVVMKTPVDTGRARGNWDASVNNEPTGFQEEKKDKTGADTIEKGKQTIQGADVSKHGDTIFLVNNVPYISDLEKGSSRQNRAGMLGPTLRELL